MAEQPLSYGCGGGPSGASAPKPYSWHSNVRSLTASPRSPAARGACPGDTSMRESLAGPERVST